MRFYASHGCYAVEQRVGGRFEVDLSYTYDVSAVLNSDMVEDAVNYLDVYALVAAQMSVTSRTVEHVAKRIMSVLFDTYGVITSIEIVLRKITPPLGGDIASVGVTLSASRKFF